MRFPGYPAINEAHIVTVYRGRLSWHTTAPLIVRGKEIMSETEFKSWVCIICGWVYDEETGAPDEGIAPGTRWEDVPDYWICPECGAGKDDFEMVEI
jgi:rubredoxin